MIGSDKIDIDGVHADGSARAGDAQGRVGLSWLTGGANRRPVPKRAYLALNAAGCADTPCNAADRACNHSHGVLAAIGLKHAQLNQISHPTRPCICRRTQASTRSGSKPLFGFPARSANQGFSSRDILNHKSAARPRFGRAQLRCRRPPVQTAVLADAAAGRDLLVSAQTGSGKTVAYGLAIAKNCSATPSGSSAPARRWR